MKKITKKDIDVALDLISKVINGKDKLAKTVVKSKLSALLK